MPVFERVREVACSAQDLFAFHAVPAALARLTPPFEKAVVIVPLLALKNGARAELQVSIGPVSTRWSAVHHDVKEGSDGGVAGFVDVMERGPFRDWGHEHCFEPLPSSTTGPRCPLTDRIKWTGPALGAGDSFVGVRLKRLFRHRHDTTQKDAEPRAALASMIPKGQRLRPGKTGSHGPIGAELRSLLSVTGHEVVPFLRGRDDVEGAVG